MSLSAPEGRSSIAQGVSPGSGRKDQALSPQPRRGDRNDEPQRISVAPMGLKGFPLTDLLSPGLTPWALDRRPLRGLKRPFRIASRLTIVRHRGSAGAGGTVG